MNDALYYARRYPLGVAGAIYPYRLCPDGGVCKCGCTARPAVDQCARIAGATKQDLPDGGRI